MEKIKKTNLVLEELNVSQLKELSIVMKPSNFKSILNRNFIFIKNLCLKSL